MPREVAVMAGVAYCVAAGFGIVAPAIPIFARSFDVSRAAAAFVISSFAFMRLISALGCGRLVNRFGERLVMGSGIGLVAGSSFLAGLAQNYWQLLVLRTAGGVGSAMFTVSAASLMLRVTTAEQRGKAMSYFQGGFLVGGISGPALGGVVTGISLRAPFFLYAVTLAAAGTVGLWFLPRGVVSASGASAGSAPLTLGAAVRMPAYRAAALTNFADLFGVFGVRVALIPLFVVEVLSLQPVWTGVAFTVFTAANVLTLFVGGRWSDSRGRRPVIMLGLVVSAVGVGLLALPSSLWLLLLAMLVWGLGSGLLDVAPAAMMGDIAGGRAGTVVAGYQMAGDAGALVGPVLGGYLADTVSYDAAFVVSAGVLVAGLVATSAAPETLVRSASESISEVNAESERLGEPGL